MSDASNGCVGASTDDSGSIFRCDICVVDSSHGCKWASETVIMSVSDFEASSSDELTVGTGYEDA